MRRLTCGNFLDGGMIWLSSSLSIVLDELPTRECWVLSPFELFSLLPLPFSIFLLFSLRFSLRLDGCEGLLSLLSLISLSLLTLSSSSSSIRLFLGLSGRISPFSILEMDKEPMKTKHLYKSRKKSSKWSKICTLQLECKQSFTIFPKILPYSLGRYIFGMVCWWFSLLFSLDFGITLGFFLGPSDDFCRCCFRFCVCIEWISTLKRPVVSPMRGRGFADHAEC